MPLCALDAVDDAPIPTELDSGVRRNTKCASRGRNELQRKGRRTHGPMHPLRLVLVTNSFGSRPCCTSHSAQPNHLLAHWDRRYDPRSRWRNSEEWVRPEYMLANQQPCQQGLSVLESCSPASTEETRAANQPALSQPPEWSGSRCNTIGQDNCPGIHAQPTPPPRKAHEP